MIKILISLKAVYQLAKLILSRRGLPILTIFATEKDDGSMRFLVAKNTGVCDAIKCQSQWDRLSFIFILISAVDEILPDIADPFGMFASKTRVN